MTISVLALLVINVLVIILNNHVQKLYGEKMVLQIETQREQANVEYYTMLQQQYENQRVLIHDFRNHVSAMAHLAESQQNKDLQNYADMMLKDPGLQKPNIFCDHRVLNMILLRYKTVCEEQKIELAIDIRRDSLPILSDKEMTALFGNLLSNAVEAAVVSVDKMIELSIKKDQGIFIALVNSCDQSPITDSSGVFKTRKNDAKKHGIGMKSIQRIVNIHNGLSEFYYDADTRQFHSVIHFPE